MNDVSLLNRQVRFELRSFWRNRSAVVATFLFPIIFLVVMGAVFQGQQVDSRGGISYLTFFLPGVLAFAIIASTFMVLANGFVVLREGGTLKRIRGTPLPTSIYLAGRICATVITALALAALAITFGVVGYDVSFRMQTMGGLVAAIVLGTFCFCALGLAATVIVPNADSAPALTNVLLFPVMFVSNVFFPLDSGPEFLKLFARVFPVYHLANALQYAFHPSTPGAGFNGTDLAVLGAWGAAGLFIAMRWFRWDPRPG